MPDESEFGGGGLDVGLGPSGDPSGGFADQMMAAATTSAPSAEPESFGFQDQLAHFSAPVAAGPTRGDRVMSFGINALTKFGEMLGVSGGHAIADIAQTGTVSQRGMMGAFMPGATSGVLGLVEQATLRSRPEAQPEDYGLMAELARGPGVSIQQGRLVEALDRSQIQQLQGPQIRELATVPPATGGPLTASEQGTPILNALFKRIGFG